MYKSYVIWLDEEDENEFVLNGKLFVGIVDGTIELQPPEIRSYWFSSLLSGKGIMDDVATGLVSLPAEKSFVGCVWRLVELPSRKKFHVQEILALNQKCYITLLLVVIDWVVLLPMVV
jgi:hypothetical protein